MQVGKAYLITDFMLYPKTLDKFYDFYKQILDDKQVDFACYRQKNFPFNYSLCEVFLRLNQEYKIPSLLNSLVEIAKQYNFDGIHCNSMQKNKIQELSKNFPYIFYSAHSLQDIKEADFFGAKGITISPIFTTPNKNKPKGIDFLNTIDLDFLKADIFALGGIITDSHVKQIQSTKIKNFASIRYFLQNSQPPSIL